MFAAVLGYGVLAHWPSLAVLGGGLLMRWGVGVAAERELVAARRISWCLLC